MKTTKNQIRFAVGDSVSLRGGKAVTTIRAFLSDVEGGVVLSDPLEGFTHWNVADLKRAKPSKNKKQGLAFRRTI